MGLIVAILLLGQWGQLFKPRIWPRPAREENNVLLINSSSDAEEVLLYSGCCVMPVSACALIFAIKRDPRQGEEPKGIPRWNIGIGYEPGICWAGEFLGWVPAAGIPTLSPPEWSYWLNSMTISVGYRFSKQSKLVIGMSYLWKYLENRWSGYAYHKYNDWKIWGTPVFFGVEKNFKQNKFYRFQLEYYFWKALDIEKIDYNKNLYISVWARGFGISFSYGLTHRIYKTLAIELASTLRLGYVKEYTNDVPSHIVWRPVTFYPSGIYFKIGLFYPVCIVSKGGKS